MRVGALHDCPLFSAQPIMPPPTAVARSASSRMMFADLPPSSCVTRFTLSAAAFATASDTASTALAPVRSQRFQRSWS